VVDLHQIDRMREGCSRCAPLCPPAGKSHCQQLPDPMASGSSQRVPETAVPQPVQLRLGCPKWSDSAEHDAVPIGVQKLEDPRAATLLWAFVVDSFAHQARGGAVKVRLVKHDR
jgi:hypothetical protein